MKIKAIETRYKGYRFRSRLEARWAVCFDSLGIKWEYEIEGFDLSYRKLNGERVRLFYLPDFWLPQVGMYCEVKPVPFTDEEERKCARLAKGTECPGVLMLDGPPDLRSYYALSYPWGDSSGPVVYTEYDIMDGNACWEEGRFFWMGECDEDDPRVCVCEFDDDSSDGICTCWGGYAPHHPTVFDPEDEGPRSLRARAVRASRSSRFEFGDRGR